MQAAVALLHGLVLGGVRQRQAEVRALDAADAEFLQRHAADGREALATRAISRMVAGLGGPGAVPPEAAARLTVGDRERLLLHVLRRGGGEAATATARCGACGEAMDFRMPWRLLLPPAEGSLPAGEGDGGRGAGVGGSAEAAVEAAPGVLVQFRVPTGADLEAVASLPSEEEAARALLARCLLDVATSGPSVPLPGGWPAAWRDAVSEGMAAADPQAVTRVAVDCAACGGRTHVRIEALDLLLPAIEARAQGLLDEVHVLASAYHWSERDILALPPARRRLYCSMASRGPRGDG